MGILDSLFGLSEVIENPKKRNIAKEAQW